MDKGNALFSKTKGATTTFTQRRVSDLDQSKQKKKQQKEWSSLMEPTPKLHEKEVRERLVKYPMSKHELVDYLLKLHQSDCKLEPQVLKKLMAAQGFKQILDEVSYIRNKKQSVQ